MTNSNKRLVAYGELKIGASTKLVNIYSKNFGEMNCHNSTIEVKNYVGEFIEIDPRYFNNIEYFTNVN